MTIQQMIRQILSFIPIDARDLFFLVETRTGSSSSSSSIDDRSLLSSHSSSSSIHGWLLLPSLSSSEELCIECFLDLRLLGFDFKDTEDVREVLLDCDGLDSIGHGTDAADVAP